MNAPTLPRATANALRQLGAAVYDGLLIAAVLMVVTFLCLRLSGYDPMREPLGAASETALRAILVAALVLYFGYAWTRRGQTLGMKAWKISVVSTDASPVTWGKALRRLLVALPLWLVAFAGMVKSMPTHDARWLWCLVPQCASLLLIHTPLARTLADLASGTRVVRD